MMCCRSRHLYRCRRYHSPNHNHDSRYRTPNWDHIDSPQYHSTPRHSRYPSSLDNKSTSRHHNPCPMRLDIRTDGWMCCRFRWNCRKHRQCRMPCHLTNNSYRYHIHSQAACTFAAYSIVPAGSTHRPNHNTPCDRSYRRSRQGLTENRSHCCSIHRRK